MSTTGCLIQRPPHGGLLLHRGILSVGLTWNLGHAPIRQQLMDGEEHPANG